MKSLSNEGEKSGIDIQHKYIWFDVSISSLSDFWDNISIGHWENGKGILDINLVFMWFLISQLVKDRQ